MANDSAKERSEQVAARYACWGQLMMAGGEIIVPSRPAKRPERRQTPGSPAGSLRRQMGARARPEMRCLINDLAQDGAEARPVPGASGGCAPLQPR